MNRPPRAGEEVTVEVYAAGEDFAVAFGLHDQFSDLSISLREFTDQLAQALEKGATDITTAPAIKHQGVGELAGCF
jgi:hypothetical protein